MAASEAASDQNNRRAEKAELARHITTDETVAFMTALIAFLDQARADRLHEAAPAQPLPADSPSTPAHPPDPAPADMAPSERQSIDGDRHATVDAPSLHDVAPAPHVDPAIGSPPVDTGGGAEATAAPQSHVTAQAAPGQHADAGGAAQASDHLGSTGGETAHADAAVSSSLDPAGLVQQLGHTITNLVDTSLAAVSHALDGLSTTVTQLTSTVTGTVGQLADNVSGLVGGLLHADAGAADHAPTANLVDALVTDIVSSPLAPAHDAAPVHEVGIAGLDTAGAVPMPALPPLALHLGFLGQPSDGHDLHDGAFSALGVHHF
jgi:hypothetical protein